MLRKNYEWCKDFRGISNVIKNVIPTPITVVGENLNVIMSELFNSENHETNVSGYVAFQVER